VVNPEVGVPTPRPFTVPQAAEKSVAGEIVRPAPDVAKVNWIAFWAERLIVRLQVAGEPVLAACRLNVTLSAPVNAPAPFPGVISVPRFKVPLVLLSPEMIVEYEVVTAVGVTTLHAPPWQ